MNAVNCFPTDETGRGRTPSPAEVKRCSEQFLTTEMAKFSHVILVGGVATSAAFNRFRMTQKDAREGYKISDLEGNVILDKTGKRLVVCYHPSYVSRKFNYPTSITQIEDQKFVRDWIDTVMRVEALIDDEPLPFEVVEVSDVNLVSLHFKV